MSCCCHAELEAHWIRHEAIGSLGGWCEMYPCVSPAGWCEFEGFLRHYCHGDPNRGPNMLPLYAFLHVYLTFPLLSRGTVAHLNTIQSLRLIRTAALHTMWNSSLVSTHVVHCKNKQPKNDVKPHFGSQASYLLLLVHWWLDQSSVLIHIITTDFSACSLAHRCHQSSLCRKLAKERRPISFLSLALLSMQRCQ